MVIAISLDVENAFNALPWEINDALRRKGFPRYLGRIIKDYLSCRSVEYVVSGGRWKRRMVRAGVPQGSVLGPVLWNIGYDSVLREGVEPGCCIICYADDTLILAETDNINVAMTRANIQTGLVLNRIRRLGLTVAVQKTEAVCFMDGRRPMRPLVLDVGGTSIETKGSMKYLGVILDSRLNFGKHVEYVAQKTSSVSRSLGRLMPNLRGPRERCRKLYANVVLYAGVI